MPYLRDRSPYYRVRLRLPDGRRTPVLNTRVRNRRVAEAMERALYDMAERALYDRVHAGVIDRLMAGELTLPEIYAANNHGTLDDLVGDNPLLAPLIRRMIASNNDRHSNIGARELLATIPAGTRLSYIRSPRTITALCEDSEREGRKRNTVRRGLMRAISKVLRRELGNAERNRIMDDVAFPGEDDSRKVYFTRGELIQLLNACEGSFRTMVMAAALTGADRGPLVRLERRHLMIEVEDGRYSGLMYLDDRKADARSRTVPLVPDLALPMYELAVDLEPTDRVFGIQYHQVDYLWREARAKIGREDARFKDLRHTFAVLAHSVGITLNDIKTGMGHGRLSTTTRYTDHDAAFSMENAEKMARLLRAG